MRRPTLVFCLLVALAAAGCGSSPKPSEPGANTIPNKQCPDQLPFTAGYLPPGYSTQLHPGPATGRPTITNATIFHYSGPGGRYIEILRGGKRAVLNGSVGIVVLGNRIARIGPFTGGSAINLRLGAARCAAYQVVTNDPDPHAAELVKVGHGLRLVAGQ